MWIVNLALLRPYTFIVLGIFIAISGTLAIISTPKDIFPPINIPVISVIWNYAGLSPEDLEQRIVDSIDLLESPRRIPAEHLLAASVDHSAGVGGVVRRIEDATLLQKVAVPWLQKLVVGPTDDQLRPDLRNRLVIENAAQRAGREDIGLG